MRIPGISTGVLAVACVAAPLIAQERSGAAALAGVIRDSAARPIASAAVLIRNTALGATSDDSGRFHIADIEPGTRTVVIMRIGYQPLEFEASLSPDSTLVIAVRLRNVTALPTVQVSAARIEQGLRRVGFTERMRSGRGSYITPQRIDSMAHVAKASLLLRDVRGIEVECVYGTCTVHTRTPPNCLWLFVDGAYTSSQIDDVLNPSVIMAMEVYERASMVPIEFQAPLPRRRANAVLSSGAGCGALVVWTRARAR